MTLQGFIFKAADGSSAPFDAVFPQIAAVEAVIEEKGEGNQGLGLRSLTRRSVREYINCSNPQCTGKGLALGLLMRRMVKEQMDRWEGHFPCESQEEAGTPCANTFQVQLTIRFKTPD